MLKYSDFMYDLHCLGIRGVAIGIRAGWFVRSSRWVV